ncbi:fatty acid desaturase family protein [Nostoc sp. CMAA1605]|uniref:fatty acid desaturase family protein n=1 Tax=Nostoc sp. CMAA1605 TaxID=2055159 RepID=UPI001F366CB9|nr:fatty acid desaturase [Nostoc sp. CMAA1605]MCF4968511.1 fatty acid desaturase [Nostoc sp. CMAA1605]
MMQNKPIDFIERNNIKSLLALLRDWIAILLIIAFSIWSDNIVVYLVSIWIIGLFQFALGEAMLHEAVHDNLFTEKSWHEKLEFIYGLPFLRTIHYYRKHHFDHHKYLWSEGDYVPEDYEILGLNKQNKNVFFIMFIKPFFGLSLYYFLVEVLYPFIQDIWTFNSLKTSYKRYLFWIIVILGFSWSGHLDILFLYWFVPLSWCFSSYSIFSEVQQHFNTYSGTRSLVNPFYDFLFHNGGYHYVHHLCPTIPWYKLAEAHQALCADNPDISHGIIDTYRQLLRKPQDGIVTQIIVERG